jgi:hypothetical protein
MQLLSTELRENCGVLSVWLHPFAAFNGQNSRISVFENLGLEDLGL